MTLRVMDEFAHIEAPACLDNPPLHMLSEREREVLNLISSGMSNKEISEKLFLSLNTVKHHLHSLYEKLNVPDRRAAAHFVSR